MNYNGKKFKALHNSNNGEVDSDLIFTYIQSGNVLHCEYSGTRIIQGHLLGQVDDQGKITMSYHQINTEGIIRTGRCISSPHVNDDGILELHEKWQWTSGDKGYGNSILIEIVD